MSLQRSNQFTIFITSPLEQNHVDRLRFEGCNVRYDPDLLPPVRYSADHNGAPFTRNSEQESRWRQHLAAADILLDFPSDMALAPNVGWVQTTSTGVGQLVRKLGLENSDFLVTTARGVHAGPLAEFVMLGLLAHFRELRHLEAEQRRHSWIRYCGEEMSGKTVVILGAGDLARATAKLAQAFGMKTEAVTRHPAKPRAHAAVFDQIHPTADLHRVLARADAIVITTPHTDETEQLLDRDAIAAIKPGAALINIARGQIIDESALVEALQSGHIGFAALDVTTIEPLPADSPLWDMPNVLISPHSASTVAVENERIIDIFIRNLRHYKAGEIAKMENILDLKLLY